MQQEHHRWPGLLPVMLLLGLVLAGTGALAAQRSLYFQDDFSGSGERAFYEGTLDARRFSYVDGRYEIDTLGGTAYGQSVLLEDLDTYRVEVTGQLQQTTDEQNAGFGLSFNYNQRDDGSDFILFLVYDRGAFTVLRYLNGQTSVLFTPAKTKLFKSGEEVTLTVDAAGGHFTCYLNGGQVCDLRDERLVSGGFGVFATAKAIVRYDNFNVYADGQEPTGFSDDFSGSQNLYFGALYDVIYSYDSERYVVDTTATDLIGLSPYTEQALDFEFEVDVELLQGEPLGGFGIYLRDFPDSDGGFNQFRFLVSRDWFAVEQSVDDMPLALAEWVQHRAVRDSGVNRLKVRAEGAKLTFFINGVEVYTHTDGNPHTGAYGFFVSSRIKVAFDNVVFTKL